MKQELRARLVQAMRSHLHEWEVRHSSLPDYLWHYTSISGVKGILTEGNLWFSDATFLNDTSELSHAVDIAEEVIGQRLKEEGSKPVVREYLQAFLDRAKGDREDRQSVGSINSAFVACFCKDGDSLHLWRAYTSGGRGYSIGFFPNIILSQLKPLQITERLLPTKLLEDGSLDFHEKSRIYRPALREVIYDEEEQKALLEKLVDSFSQIIIDFESELQLGNVNNWTKFAFVDQLFPVFYQYLCCFKHPTFKEEHEWRFIYTPDLRLLPTTAKGAIKKDIEYRESGGYIVPYIKVNIAERQENIKRVDQVKSKRIVNVREIPFEEIITGPGLDEKLARASLHSFLTRNGSLGTSIGIEHSSVPLRNI